MVVVPITILFKVFAISVKGHRPCEERLLVLLNLLLSGFVLVPVFNEVREVLVADTLLALNTVVLTHISKKLL